MGRLISALAPREGRALTANDAIRNLWSGVKTAAGVHISEQTSLEVLSVYTAVRILSEGFAQVPLKVYRKVDGGREEATEHRLYKILHERPNPEMTSFTLRETKMGHLGTWGNAYCELQRNFFDEVIAIWPLLPDRTKKRRARTGEIFYQTRIPRGENQWEDVILPARNVMHTPGLGFDGQVGYSPISLIREGVALAKAYEQFGSRFFGNGAIPGFILSTDKTMKTEQRKEIETTWAEQHQGLSNSQRLAILDGGLKPEKIGIPPEDAQFIEASKHQRGEIMGFYRIPPHLTGDTEKASSWGTGIAEMSVGFIKFTMDPWFVRDEQVINTTLLGSNAQGPLYAEFDREGFLRGDFPKRVTGYESLFKMGAISNAQIARLENLPKPPREVWSIPSTVTPLDRLDEVLDKQTVPEPVKPDGDGGDAAPVGEKPKPDSEAKADPAARAAIASGFRSALADATDRILRRERADVGRGVEKLLKADRAADIEPWLESFYDGHRNYARRQVEPLFTSLFELVRSDIARELGRETAGPVPAFVRKFSEGYAERLGQESLEELRRAVRGEPQLERIFAAWDRREIAIAARESVRAANAFALVVYRALGVAEVRWVARDDRPECHALAERTVAIGDPFTDRVSHPPLGDGCECVIVSAHAQRTDQATAPQVVVHNNITVPDREVRIEQPITVTVPEREVHVRGGDVRGGDVHVDAPVTVPEREVHVRGGDVHVDAPVTVPEREVRIDAPITVQAQPAMDLELEHDPAGNLKSLRRKPSKG